MAEQNPDNVDAPTTDPLCGFMFTASAYDDMFYGIQDMHDLMQWNLKTRSCRCVYCRRRCPVTGGRRSEVGGDAAGSCYDDIEMRVFKSLRHELLNEKEKDQVMAEILDWISRKVEGCADRQPASKAE
ncbi:MAG: hypothetical protein ACLSA6_18905 [Holdemania massiliensis]